MPEHAFLDWWKEINKGAGCMDTSKEQETTVPQDTSTDGFVVSGLELRDRMALSALPGIMANPATQWPQIPINMQVRLMTDLAYRVADSMLVSRDTDFAAQDAKAAQEAQLRADNAKANADAVARPRGPQRSE